MAGRVSVILALIVTLSGALLLPAGRSLAQNDPLAATTRTVNVELILDSSGSMAEALANGETRMDAAKRILREVIAGLPEREGVNVGLRVYGHLGDNTETGKAVSCRSSELLVPIARVDKALLTQTVEAIQPTGWTPIAYALEQAAADFQPGGESITNAIVLVTDGEETCDPPAQACDAAAALRQAGIAVTTHVVGFALTPQQTEQVRCIAEQGGGELFGADDAAGLGTAIGSALAGAGVSITPVAITPVAVAPAAPAVPLAEIHTLAYHQLTAWTSGANERGEEAPLLSDDGQRIAFARAPGTQDPVNPNRIFVMNADGSGEQEVDAYTSLCFCGALIDLSADGSRIVSSDAVQLRIAEASGGGGRELLALDSNELNAVRISGDGSTVVFRIYRDTSIRDTSPAQPIERGIYVINADGSGLRQIVGPSQIAPLLGVDPADAPFFSAIFGVDVSTNGGQIVFGMLVAPESGGWGQGLFAVNRDGSGLHQLLERVGWVLNGAISGNGSTVAYATGNAADDVQEAGVIGFDGSGQRALTGNATAYPGIGVTLPSGERIQLSQDGSRLLLGSTGLLFDTTSGDRLILGATTASVGGDPHPLVVDGLYRPSMNAEATRFVYLFQPPGEPYQLVRLDLNPADLGAAPSVTEASVTPAFILTETRSTATVSARVSTPNAFLRVGSRVLFRGLPDPNVNTAYYGPMVDDGASLGDAVAGDGLFTYDGISTDCCAEVGPRIVRVKAETQAADGLRHATAVDVVPFAVVAEIPAASEVTPTLLPDQVSTPVVTQPVTPSPVTPPGEDAAAQATIAAQATLIAELQRETPTPSPVTEEPATPEIVEPRFTAQADPTQLAVGETVRVWGELSGVGIPIFGVRVRDVDTGLVADMASIDYGGQLKRGEGGSRILELVDASVTTSGFDGTIDVTFRAIGPGTAEVRVGASGEVSFAGGGYSWGGADAPPVPITVVASTAASPSLVVTEEAEVPPQVDGLITPDPAECTISPRTPESLTAITPDPAAADALAAARLDPALTIPEGAPADASTTAAVGQTYRLMIACFNAGNDLAAYALWTDAALRQLQLQPPAGTLTPVAEAERAAFRVTEVRTLADGQVVAVVEERTPLFAVTLVQVLARQGEHYLITETVDARTA